MAGGAGEPQGSPVLFRSANLASSVALLGSRLTEFPP